MLLISRDLCPNTSGRFSVRERVLSAGLLYLENRKISTARMKSSWSYSQRISISRGGSRWLGNRCHSRDYHPGSAGWDTASGLRQVWHSTTWSLKVRWKPPLWSAGTIWILVQWLLQIEKPKAWRTGQMPWVIGRSWTHWSMPWGERPGCHSTTVEE